MAKSKRSKTVALTRVQKKGKENKEKLVQKLHDALDDAVEVFVFTYEDMKSDRLNALRNHLRGKATMMLAKRTVMTHALGHTEEEEYRTGLSGLCKYLKGNSGVIASTVPQADIQAAFDKFSAEEYATTGTIAARDIIVPSGPLDHIAFPFSMEVELRGLGLPTQLKDGVINVLMATPIASAGQPITSQQARLLRHFGH
ncbi:ribosomal protein L10P, partial [Kipferlia bialata]|eukprot:g12163.t1